MTSAARRVTVRPYNPSTDLDDVIEICKATAHPSIHSAADILPHIYAIPYVNLEPDLAFVLEAAGSCDDGTSATVSVVGYIIGTANTQLFVERYQTTHLISGNLPVPMSGDDGDGELRNTFLRILHEPEGMLHARHPELLQQYPAHLHIDILPSHQGQGHGGILMTEFLEELRKRGVKGVHLGMRADNTLAKRFYEKNGFREYVDIKSEGETVMVRGGV